MRCNLIWILLIAGLFAGCSETKRNSGEREDSQRIEAKSSDEVTEVTVMKLTPSTFNHEIVSNGKLMARRMAELRFESAEQVAAIYVKNGDRVRAGQKIAELSTFRLANKVSQAKTTLESARIELQDVLIGQGYQLEDSLKVPAATLRLAKVKSGYDQASNQYALAKYELDHALLKAPFDGTVANLFTKPYNMSSTTDAFCSIIDNNSLEADFTILESELQLIREGDRVEVTPFALKDVKGEGRITEINPIVNESGMVRVKAAVGGGGKFFDGMNVRVSIHRSVANKIVVPKTAVVVRSDKEVVFVYKNGKAMWTYVQTGLENVDSYTIEDESLKPGDMIITGGNVNLAHESPVRVVSGKAN